MSEKRHHINLPECILGILGHRICFIKDNKLDMTFAILVDMQRFGLREVHYLITHDTNATIIRCIQLNFIVLNVDSSKRI